MSPNDTAPSQAQALFGHSEVQENGTVGQYNPPDLGGRALWISTMNTLWPWKRWEYRGRLKAASDAAGYSVKSVDRWRYAGCFGVPPAAARRIVALLKAEIDARQQLLLAWSEYLKDASVQDRAAEEFAQHKARKAMFD